MILAMPSKDDRGPKIEVYQVSRTYLHTVSQLTFTRRYIHTLTKLLLTINLLGVKMLDTMLPCYRQCIVHVAEYQDIVPCYLNVLRVMFGWSPTFLIKIFASYERSPRGSIVRIECNGI